MMSLRASEEGRRDMVARNLWLHAELDKYILARPEFLDHIPQGAHLVVISATDPELAQYNRELAKRLQEEGHQVVFVSFDPAFALEEA